MSFILWTLPSFWGTVRSLHIVLLLHVYIPPSHCDSYQGKALLQCPGVHHGFHIHTFLVPVLDYTEKGRCITHLVPNLREQSRPTCTQSAATNWHPPLWAPWSFPPFPSLLPWLPSRTVPNHGSSVTASTVYFSVSSTTLMSWQVAYLSLLGTPWGWHSLDTKQAQKWVNEGSEGRESDQIFNTYIIMQVLRWARWEKAFTQEPVLPKW